MNLYIYNIYITIYVFVVRCFAFGRITLGIGGGIMGIEDLFAGWHLSCSNLKVSLGDSFFVGCW